MDRGGQIRQWAVIVVGLLCHYHWMIWTGDNIPCYMCRYTTVEMKTSLS